MNNNKFKYLDSNKNELIKLMKELDEDVGKYSNNGLVIYSGVTADAIDKEVSVYITLAEDGCVNLSSDEAFSIYAERNFDKDQISKLILNRLDQKKHKGLMGFDVDKWAITGYCKIEEYPYVKWAIVEIVEDICADVF